MPGVFGLDVVTMRRIRRLRDRWLKTHGSDQCHRGCSDCCRQAVGTLIVEGIDIAGGYPDWRWQRETLADDAALGRRLRRCMFLDGDGGCSIYARRPISCSTMFPAGPCTPATTKVVDAREPVWAAREFDMRFCRKIGLEYPGPVLLSAAVLIGLDLLAGRKPTIAPEWQTMSIEKLRRLRGAARVDHAMAMERP